MGKKTKICLANESVNCLKNYDWLAPFKPGWTFSENYA
jgi:hypothetical protein